MAPRRNLVVVTDATGSMGSFLSSIAASISQFLSVMKLTDGFDRVRLLAYYDYCDDPVTRCSEWGNSIEELNDVMRFLRPTGGGDWPEAAKTAAYQVIGWLKGEREKEEQKDEKEEGKDAITTVIWYADAPPHHSRTSGSNYSKEKSLLGERESDWVWLSKELAKCGASVYPIINTPAFDTASFFTVMAHLTGGQALYIRDITPANITRVTVNLVLGIMGCEFELGEEISELSFTDFPAYKILDENEGNLGYLVGSKHGQTQALTVQKPAAIAPIDKLRTDLTLAGRRFDKDDAYRDAVYAEFKHLITPNSVLALTYNSVFGALWRAICRQRKDSRTEQLLLALHDALNTLAPDDAKTVRYWLEASYDRVAEVKARLAEHTGPAFPALFLDRPVHMGPAPTTQELLELARSCHPSVLTRTSSLITCLRLAQDPAATTPSTSASQGQLVESNTHDSQQASRLESNTDDSQQAGHVESSTDEETFTLEYLPLSLPDSDLFSLLPHLLAPGTVFSRRPAIILASLAILSNSPLLADRARSYLTHNRGKWFDAEQPENYSMDLARIMLEVHHALQSSGHPPALTPDEHQFFTLMARLGGVTINAHTSLHLTQSCTPFKLMRPDRKHTCRQCHTPRSFTLTTPSGTCGLCLSDCALLDDGTTVPEPEPGRSHWCECKTCRGHYAVVRIDLMNVGPKCHFCRNGMPAPLRECSVCTNKFVDPCLEAQLEGTHQAALEGAHQAALEGTHQAALEGTDNAVVDHTSWVCPACEVDRDSSFQSVEVQFRELVTAQPEQLLSHLLGLSVPSGVDVFQSGSLFKLVASLGVKWLEGKGDAGNVHMAEGSGSASGDQGHATTADGSGDGAKAAKAVEVVELSGDDGKVPVEGGAFNDGFGHASGAMNGVSAADVVARTTATTHVTFHHNGKPVLNTPDVCTQILNWVGSGKAETGTCMLCYQTMSKKKLQGTCGRGSCQAVACAECLSAWYGVPRPGHVISLANFLCPFCKGPASTKTLQRFNKLACAVKGRMGSEFLTDPTWFYGWCTGCYRAKQCIPKTCAVDLNQLPTSFQCEECEVAAAARAVDALKLAADGKVLLAGAKPCPKCGHGVVKASGCDHIACVCAEHWCWQCGEGGFDEYSIYGHIGGHEGDVGFVGEEWNEGQE